MKLRDAEAALVNVEVIPLFEAPLTEAKRLQEMCLEADIPAVLGADEHCKTGCAPRAQLLVREDDAARVLDMVRTEWTELALREGTVKGVQVGAVPPTDPEGDPPCPACGCTQPLVDGACPDCGLTLG